jgi:hypothetical protein
MSDPSSQPLDFTVQELATILARGYLRLLARKAAPGAGSQAQELAGSEPKSLEDVSERSPHGRRG